MKKILIKTFRKYNRQENIDDNQYYKSIIIKIIIFRLLIFVISKSNFYLINIDEESNNKLNLMKQKFENETFIKPYIENISIISNYKSKIKSNKKNIINICMNINNRYKYPVLVSMESALINCNKKETLLKYHILCPYDINNTTLLKFKSLMERYPDNLELIIYNMSKVFLGYRYSRFSQTCFYRLLAPAFLDLDKIIYLDGDTLIFQDLKEMYDTPFNDNYVLGFLDIISWGVDYLRIRSNRYINSGVLLMNLTKIREDKKYIDLVKVITNGTRIYFDQTVLNFILYPKIGLLPYKFGIWNFQNKAGIIRYTKFLRQILNISELVKAYNNPGLVHLVLCEPKPFYSRSKYRGGVACMNRTYNCSCFKYYNIWHYYAQKSSFYPEIKKYFK